MIVKRKVICINFFIILIIPMLSFTATANQPPEAPIITGPTSGTVGKVYEYTLLFSNANFNNFSFSFLPLTSFIPIGLSIQSSVNKFKINLASPF